MIVSPPGVLAVRLAKDSGEMMMLSEPTSKVRSFVLMMGIRTPPWTTPLSPPLRVRLIASRVMVESISKVWVA